MLKSFKIITLLQNNEEKEITDLLKISGYASLHCYNTNQLSDLITAHHHNIGLLMLDSNLIGIDIPGLCLKLKTNEYLNAFIMVLGNTHSGVGEIEALDAGADAFIHRPIRPALLIKRIDAILARK